MPSPLAVPLEFPQLMGFSSRRFQIGNFQQITPGGRGFLQTIERSRPWWVAEYETPPLSPDRYNEVTAFLDELQGSMETFLAYDPRRPMPYAYRNLSVSSDPWVQVGQVAPRATAANYAASTLTLDRMANGAVITKGDYISFLVGYVWYLFRATETVAAAANTATVKVKPRPFGITGLPVNIRYRRACAQMKILGGYTEQDSVDSFPAVSFKAVQFLDRST